ncbi:class F sortase [Naasia sp. SYSU D00948]|uniref:class F sortase n=1 Tax=Naasia sp. SYSU D00948 TaxID=2817379 RepID=UPI001B3083E5|nr:class F sortase [Naasia sp. SYSU D00948]
MIRTTALVGLVLLLSGCAAPTVAPAPVPPVSSPGPVAPAPATTRNDIPIRTTEPRAMEAPVPPVRVRVPGVEVDVEVIPVGVRADSFMELPDYVGTAGWYRYGSGPTSDEGTTVIAAHVDSLEWGLGPFARLRDLPFGAEVLVTTQDGVEHRYLVESVVNLRKEELPVGEIFARTGPERLVLITCGGRFDREALRYSDNVLVTAVPVQ